MFDYDETDEWIKDMYNLAEMGLPASVVAFGDNAKMVGLSMVFIGECANDDVALFERLNAAQKEAVRGMLFGIGGDMEAISEPGALL